MPGKDKLRHTKITSSWCVLIDNMLDMKVDEGGRGQKRAGPVGSPGQPRGGGKGSGAVATGVNEDEPTWQHDLIAVVKDLKETIFEFKTQLAMANAGIVKLKTQLRGTGGGRRQVGRRQLGRRQRWWLPRH